MPQQALRLRLMAQLAAFGLICVAWAAVAPGAAQAAGPEQSPGGQVAAGAPAALDLRKPRIARHVHFAMDRPTAGPGMQVLVWGRVTRSGAGQHVVIERAQGDGWVPLTTLRTKTRGQFVSWVGNPGYGSFSYRASVLRKGPLRAATSRAVVLDSPAPPVVSVPVPVPAPSPPIGGTEVPAREIKALVAIYDGTGGPSWLKQGRWLSTESVCSWQGVTCAARHVTELQLSDNHLTGSLPGAVGDLGQLTSLAVGGNNLSSLPNRVGDLSHLSLLSASYNDLDVLPETLGRLTGLMTLNVSNNRLSTLPQDIGSAKQLAFIDARDNQIQALPPSISRITNLVDLFLSDNHLHALPDDLGALKNLGRLDLDANQLEALPESVGSMGSLRELSAAVNRLTEIPDTVANLPSLTTLDLQYNDLSALPSGIVRLPRLQYLFVGNNRLSTLPPDVGSLTSLSSLDLDHNQLTSLPASLGKLTDLRWFRARQNSLTGDITPWIAGLRQARKLTYLALSDGQDGNHDLSVESGTDLAAWVAHLDPQWNEAS